LKSVTHILLTDPMRHFSRWHFYFKSHLMNADPLFGNTLEGEDNEWLYYYELAVAKLLTTIVKDEDVAYVVAGATRRNKDRPATAALAALSDAYQYDPLDHIQTLKTVQPPIQHPAFKNLSFFTMDVLEPLDPMATMTVCATLWPVTMLFQLHGNPCWSSSKSPCALSSSATSALPGFHFLAASRSLPSFNFFSFSCSSRLLSSSSFSSSASSQLHCFRLFGLRGSVER
uniref:hypothetical protein n=1 Tax=Limnohabitans sp. TaxID=1907725 RepID=UPI002AFEED85